MKVEPYIGEERPDPAAVAEARYPVQFTASAGEYFRIWIVNLALTIATLGIYSAWAKVRKKRYFYAHTKIDGDGFEYRGRPLAILKGRVIAVALVGAFYGATNFVPGLLVPVILVASLVLPWLIVRSLAFNAYNTAHRNLRLHFRGTYGRCMRILIGWGLFTVCSFGLGYPSLKKRLLQFGADYHFYGSTQFRLGEFSVYRIYLIGVVGLGALAGAFIGPVVLSLRDGLGDNVKYVATLGSYLTYLMVFSYLRSRIANAAFGNLTLGAVRFECKLRARDLFWLYVVNIVAIVATLGLAAPWAVVRTMRYRAEKMTVVAPPDGLGQFVRGESAQVGAAGEEVGEMFGVDFGL